MATWILTHLIAFGLGAFTIGFPKVARKVWNRIISGIRKLIKYIRNR